MCWWSAKLELNGRIGPPFQVGTSEMRDTEDATHCNFHWENEVQKLSGFLGIPRILRYPNDVVFVLPNFIINFNINININININVCTYIYIYIQLHPYYIACKLLLPHGPGFRLRGLRGPVLEWKQVLPLNRQAASCEPGFGPWKKQTWNDLKWMGTKVYPATIEFGRHLISQYWSKTISGTCTMHLAEARLGFSMSWSSTRSFITSEFLPHDFKGAFETSKGNSFRKTAMLITSPNVKITKHIL